MSRISSLITCFTSLALAISLSAQSVHSVAEAEEMIRQGRRCADTQEFLNQPSRDADPKILLLRCQSLFDRKQYVEAQSACEKSIAFGGGDVSTAHHLLADILSERVNSVGIFAKMRLAGRIQRELKRAVELDPKDGSAREGLAQFYSQAPAIAGGSRAQAYQQAQAASAFDPGLAHLITSALKRTDKDDAAALAELRLAVQSAPNSPVVLSRAGSSLLDMGYPTEAHSHLAKALSLDPNSPEIAYQFARSVLLEPNVSSAELSLAEELLQDYATRCPGAYRPGISQAQALLSRIHDRGAGGDSVRPAVGQKP